MSKAATPLSTYDEYYNAIATGTTIIKFSGEWCAPCKKIAKPFAAIAEEWQTIKFHEIDIDIVPEVAIKEDITAVPQFVCYYNGERLFNHVGGNEKQLRENISSWLIYIDNKTPLLDDPSVDKLSSILSEDV